jgi:hypothetical protein
MSTPSPEVKWTLTDFGSTDGTIQYRKKGGTLWIVDVAALLEVD